jgi:queuine tRNA-ribosyltransferase
LWTAHGPIDTPAFMPVGTYGAVKGLVPEELAAIGSQVILGNAYHLGHRPGADVVRALGGLHGFSGWSGPILTDSGGYQVFSLRSLQTIDDGGVDYQTHFDGSRHRMTPRSVLEVQAALGSDICMILDHCPPGDADAAVMGQAMRRTTRWAEEAAALRGEILAPDQLCFGIVQGGTDLDARRAHLDQLSPLRFDGLALGGLSVGEPIPAMHATMAAIAPQMPQDRPRYVMGIGTPADLLAAIRSGVDIFDCVIPTRHARNGQLFTWEGRVNIRHAVHKTSGAPIDSSCACQACQGFSRGYLRHLHRSGDPLYVRLATLHNLFFFHQWVATLRQALRSGDFAAAAADLSEALESAQTPD